MRMVAVMLVYLSAAIPCLANTINVNASGTGDFNTIQAAINAAVNGDTVLLQPGTYGGAGNRDIDFKGKAITVRGATGDPNDCVIDCHGSSLRGRRRGFKFVSSEDANSILKSLTITNGYAPEEDISGDGYLLSVGGAIYCNSGSPRISECIFRNNTASSGGAIYSIEAGCPNIENCTIINNTALGSGGGIEIDGSWPGSTVIKNCFISGNSAFYGGGISYSGNLIIDKCNIVNNSVSAYGGGIYSSNTIRSTIKNSVISGNSADYYGGGIYNNFSSQEVNNCVISNNSAVEDGGGIENVYNTTIKMNNCTVINNSAGYGGGISNYSTSGVINNCIIWGNIPSQQITAASSAITAGYCDIQGGYAGMNNINADPCLVNNYHISMTSPCFNTGDPNYIPDINETDIDGDPRLMVRIDIGADEYAAGPPHIVLSKQIFNFQADGISSNPPQQSLTITNYGRTRLNWHLENVCEWLEIIPSSASLEAGETGNVIIGVKPNIANYGINICEFAVVDSNAENSPQAVTVNINVLRPAIGVDKTSISFTAHGKSDTSVAAQQLVISNTGYDTLNWHIEIPNCNWLIANPSSGQVTDGNSVVLLTVDPNKAPAYGANSATINIIDTNASNSPKAVTVTLQVYGPVIYVSPPSSDIYAERNARVQETFIIQNSGYDVLHWNIGSPNDCNWLKTIEPASGQCARGESKTVTITIDTSNLNEGQYQAQLLISSPEVSSIIYYLYLTVYTSGEIHVPEDYNTIQAAINAALTGDIIIVHPGKYAGFNDDKAALTIQSIDPENPAIVAATIIESPSTIYSSGTIINGLSFIYNPGFSSSSAYAIYTVSSLDAQIKNCRILNFSGCGMIIAGQYPGAHIEKCEIRNNGYGRGTGGIVMGGAVDIDNCLIAGNFGGGISAYKAEGSGSNSFYITNSTIADNYAGTSRTAGRGIALIYPLLTLNMSLRNCVLSNKIGPNDLEIFADPAMSISCSMEIAYSQIKGGPAAISAQHGMNVLWGVGNIDMDPCFVNAVNWADNNTPGNTNDDMYIGGDYHLKSSAGRWEWNELIDMDAQGDGFIDTQDFAILASEWQKKSTRQTSSGRTPSYCTYLRADLDRSGRVDLADLVIFCENYLNHYDMGRWVYDNVNSACIDAGDPNSDWTKELWPHGKRINMGAYGGTSEASMSPSTVGNISDIDNSGMVDVNDLILFIQQWSQKGIFIPGDLSRNLTVDFIDFSIFAENWAWQE